MSSLVRGSFGIVDTYVVAVEMDLPMVERVGPSGSVYSILYYIILYYKKELRYKIINSSSYNDHSSLAMAGFGRGWPTG